LKDAATARDELAKARTKYADQTRKLQAEGSNFKKQYDELKANHEERDDNRVALEQERTARQKRERLTMENKALQRKIASDNTTHSKERDASKESNETLSTQVKDFEVQVSSLQKQLSGMRQTLDVIAGRNKELVAMNDKLEIYSNDLQMVNKIKGELRTSIELCESLKARNRDLSAKEEHFHYLEVIQKDKEKADKRCEKLQETVENFEVRIQDLLDELEVKKPLVQKAVDIRMRFLAQAKSITPGLRKVIDCEASLRTSKPSNNSNQGFRRDVNTIIANLKSHYRRHGEKAEELPRVIEGLQLF
jgi:DNA repair exonuclease SbcCD ATPase subunit